MPQPLTLYKLIILYMLNEVNFPMTNSQLADFILGNEYTNYFHLQQAISEMVETNLIEKKSVRNTSYYSLTESGETTLSFFNTEISPEIKEDVKKFLEEKGCQLRDEVFTTADYYKTTEQEYAVRCQVRERNAQLIDLTFMVPSKEAAESVCVQWPAKCQEIYAFIMEKLL